LKGPEANLFIVVNDNEKYHLILVVKSSVFILHLKIGFDIFASPNINAYHILLL